jgi:hypothetical protein
MVWIAVLDVDGDAEASSEVTAAQAMRIETAIDRGMSERKQPPVGNRYTVAKKAGYRE